MPQHPGKKTSKRPTHPLNVFKLFDTLKKKKKLTDRDIKRITG